jgi:AbrB family looped-hinge helix DNA binding protein
MAQTSIKISPKFQVVIPKEIRERMKLKPKQEVSVFEKDGIIYVIPIRPMKELRGFAKGLDTSNIREKEDRL